MTKDIILKYTVKIYVCLLGGIASISSLMTLMNYCNDTLTWNLKIQDSSEGFIKLINV